MYDEDTLEQEIELTTGTYVVKSSLREILDEIIDSLNKEEVEDVVKYLDNKVSDWQFTLSVHRYFLTEIKSLPPKYKE